jgi:hypothetical protein
MDCKPGLGQGVAASKIERLAIPEGLEPSTS